MRAVSVIVQKLDLTLLQPKHLQPVTMYFAKEELFLFVV